MIMLDFKICQPSSTLRQRFVELSAVQGLQENLGRQTAVGAGHLPQAETDPAGFCLYGYVQALFIEFRHTIPLQEEGA